MGGHDLPTCLWHSQQAALRDWQRHTNPVGKAIVSQEVRSLPTSVQEVQLCVGCRAAQCRSKTTFVQQSAPAARATRAQHEPGVAGADFRRLNSTTPLSAPLLAVIRRCTRTLWKRRCQVGTAKGQQEPATVATPHHPCTSRVKKVVPVSSEHLQNLQNKFSAPSCFREPALKQRVASHLRCCSPNATPPSCQVSTPCPG